MDAVMNVRIAARSLLRTPGTSGLIVLLFAVGVGLTTAVFSFFQAAVLRPLPYADPDRLVFVSESHPDRGKNSAFRPGNFHDLKEEGSVFSSATASSSFEARFEEEATPELLKPCVARFASATLTETQSGVTPHTSWEIWSRSTSTLTSGGRTRWR
ncbi:MAG: hypothetical protein ACREDF_11290 [Thermoplasmata archaeon]